MANLIVPALAVVLLLSVSSRPALAAVADDAAVVFLRTSCDDGTGGTLNNCFASMNSLRIWLVTTRQPDASNPLLVEIGPGEFGQAISCSNSGHVTYRGAGRENTTIRGQVGFDLGAAVFARNCEALEISNLRLETPGNYGVVWWGTGTSTWTDVDMFVEDARWGWFEDTLILTLSGACNGSSSGVHYWYSSNITVNAGNGGALAYLASCHENWFFGGEITVKGSTTTAGAAVLAGVGVANTGSLRTFGTVVRALSADASSADFDGGTLGAVGVTGVTVGHDSLSELGGGVYHAHGGNIMADSVSAPGENATALDVRSGGFAHTPGSSFVVNTAGGGVATRLTSAGTARSPFVWRSAASPPAIGSEDGADMFVETDCESDGDCDGNPSATGTHLMIYNANECPGDPWFDVVTARCRNDTGP